eukprot:COSAG04_NODE_791_length_10285_cov_3.557628_8_plen_215_part_00
MASAARQLRALRRHVAPAGSSSPVPALKAPDPEAHREAGAAGDARERPGGPQWFYSGRAERIYAGGYDCATGNLDARELAASLHRDGLLVLRSALPVRWVDDCAAAFAPHFAAHLESGTHEKKKVGGGPARFDLPLPMGLPFAEIASHELLGALFRELLGDDAVITQLGSDTAGCPSTYQMVHLDGAKEAAGPFHPTIEGQLADPTGIGQGIVL